MSREIKIGEETNQKKQFNLITKSVAALLKEPKYKVFRVGKAKQPANLIFSHSQKFDFTMHNLTNYSKPFRVVAVEEFLPKDSLFACPHIYMSSNSVREMKLVWGQPISITTFKFGHNKLVRTFVLINQTLRNDQLIICSKVANELELTSSKLDLILLTPQAAGEILHNQIAPPQLNIDETLIKQGSKNFTPEPNSVYCRKKNYEMMAFLTQGVLKLQIKVFARKNKNNPVKVYQTSDFQGVQMTHQQILECLEDSTSHSLFLQLGIIALRAQKKIGKTYQIQLKEVPPFYNLDTEMLIARLQDIKRSMPQGSFGEGNKSRSIVHAQTQQDISFAMTPNGGKSAKTTDTKASSNSNFHSQGGLKNEWIKPKKKIESDPHLPKLSNLAQPNLKTLEDKLLKMQEEIKILKDSCDKMTKKADKVNKKMEQINEQTNEKLNAIVKEDWLAIENVKKNIQSIYREFSESSDYTKNIIRKSFIEMDRKLKDISLNCSKFSSSGIVVQKDDREAQDFSLAIPMFPKINPASAFISDYKISGDLQQRITREGKSEWTQLLTKDLLEYNSKTMCSLKIIRSKFNFIMVGIVDQQRINQRSSWTQDHCLTYCGWNNLIYVSGEPVIDNAAILKEGGQITMEIQPEKGIISWSLDGCRYAKKSRILKDSEIGWVPYIEMFTPGDTVQWQ